MGELIIKSYGMSDGVEVGVGLFGIEYSVGPDDGDHVFGVGEVDEVVSVAGYHFDYLEFVAAHFKGDDGVGVPLFVVADFSQLYQAVAADYEEALDKVVVPVLPFGYAGFRYVDGYLTVVVCFDKFGKASAGICVHLQRE